MYMRACGFYARTDGLMLVVQATAESGTASRSDMDFLNGVIILLNVVLFAIPIIESFMDNVCGKQFL